MTNVMIRELADARRSMAFVPDCTTATVTGRVGQLGSDVEEVPPGDQRSFGRHMPYESTLRRSSACAPNLAK